MSEQYNIPDLSHLSQINTAIFSLQHLFGPQIQDYQTRMLVSNFIRLVDLSVDEYKLGREAMNNVAGTRGMSLIRHAYRATSHFEVCISTVKRVIGHLKAIRSHPRAAQKLKDLCPRNSIVLRGQVEGKITAMRDAIIHLEEAIKHGKINEGAPAALVLEKDYLELGEHKLSINDLAAWLQELHTIASSVANYTERPSI